MGATECATCGKLVRDGARFCGYGGHDPGKAARRICRFQDATRACTVEALDKVDVRGKVRAVDVAQWGDLVACMLPGTGKVTVILGGAVRPGEPFVTTLDLPMDAAAGRDPPSAACVPTFVDGLAVFPVGGDLYALDAAAREPQPMLVAQLSQGLCFATRLVRAGPELHAMAVGASGDVSVARILPPRNERDVIILLEQRPWQVELACATKLGALGVPAEALSLALPLRGRWMVPSASRMRVADPAPSSGEPWGTLEVREEHQREGRTIDVSREFPLQYVGDASDPAGCADLLVPMRCSDGRTWGRITCPADARRATWAPAPDTRSRLLAGRDAVFDVRDPADNAVVVKRTPPAGGAGGEVPVPGAASVLGVIDLEDSAIVCAETLHAHTVVHAVDWLTRLSAQICSAADPPSRLVARPAICGSDLVLLFLRGRALHAAAVPLGHEGDA